MKKIAIAFLFFSNMMFAQTEEFFPPEQLKPGMKGYLLTVLEGLEPEKVDIEVVAYMPRKLTKGSMILIKLVDEKTKVTHGAAGMSGSPVYIDEKLLGALAYGWSFAKEAIVGVVPIKDMLSDKIRSENTLFPNALPLKTMWSLEGLDSPSLMNALTNMPSNKQRSIPGVEEFTIVKSSRSNGIAPLKGGDAVAIKLVDGDISLGAIGTVTYVNGEDVYIFGHPMDQDGPVSLPLSRAQIFHVLANYDNSFKMGSALSENIGSTIFDGMSAVYGRFDRMAKMIPVQVNVAGMKFSNTYNFSLARSKKYLPLLLGKVIGDILDREIGKNIERQINMSWNIKLTNNEIVSNNTTWVKGTLLAPESISEFWNGYISVLWGNHVQFLVPEELKIDVDITDKSYNSYFLSSFTTSRKTFLGGEKIDFRAAIDPFFGDLFYTNISISLPKNIKSGKYTVLAGSPLDVEMQLFTMFPEFYNIHTEEQLIKELEKPYKTKGLMVMIIGSADSAVSGNNILPKMPKAKQSLFRHKTFDQQAITSPMIFSNLINFDEPVVGMSMSDIDVIIPEPVTVK